MFFDGLVRRVFLVHVAVHASVNATRSIATSVDNAYGRPVSRRSHIYSAELHDIQQSVHHNNTEHGEDLSGTLAVFFGVYIVYTSRRNYPASPRTLGVCDSSPTSTWVGIMFSRRRAQTFCDCINSTALDCTLTKSNESGWSASCLYKYSCVSCSLHRVCVRRVRVFFPVTNAQNAFT